MPSPKPSPRRDAAGLETARLLLQIEAVNFRPERPYTLTSGWASPVYIDCRKLISYPRIRSTCMDFACSVLMRDAGYEAFDAVAGGLKRLDFDHVHDGIVRKGEFFVSCADFYDGDKRLYDIDFLVVEEEDALYRVVTAYILIDSCRFVLSPESGRLRNVGR